MVEHFIAEIIEINWVSSLHGEETTEPGDLGD